MGAETITAAPAVLGQPRYGMMVTSGRGAQAVTRRACWGRDELGPEADRILRARESASGAAWIRFRGSPGEFLRLEAGYRYTDEILWNAEGLPAEEVAAIFESLPAPGLRPKAAPRPEDASATWGAVRALEACHGIPLHDPDLWHHALDGLTRLTGADLGRPEPSDSDEAWSIAVRLVSLPVLSLREQRFYLPLTLRTPTLSVDPTAPDRFPFQSALPTLRDLRVEDLAQAVGATRGMFRALPGEPVLDSKLVAAEVIDQALVAPDFSGLPRAFFEGASWDGLISAFMVPAFRVILRDEDLPPDRWAASAEHGFVRVIHDVLQEAPSLQAAQGRNVTPLLYRAQMTPPSGREALMCRRLNP